MTSFTSQADGKGSLVLDWQGIRVGLVIHTQKVSFFSVITNSFLVQIGLVEKEWLDTLAAVDPGHVTYTDYVECGRLRNDYSFLL